MGELQNATVELDCCLEVVVAAIATSAPVDQNVTNKSFGRRPFLTLAWGKAPGIGCRQDAFWPKAIFTWSLKIDLGDEMNLAFSHSDHVRSQTWGVAPGLGDPRPSALFFRSVVSANLVVVYPQ